MKLIKTILFISILSICINIGFSDDTSHSFHSGTSLVNETDKHFSAYVLGVFDGIKLMEYETTNICSPKDLTSYQIVSIIKKHFENNPEKLHFTAPSSIYIALIEAFPCN